jgi:23S rRNA (adenine2030-N6)-methyltransferase
MNYRHAFHAGNHADVLKHVVLCRVLDYLKLKDKLFHVLDAHAGIGIYALDGKEAQKTKEYEGGIGKMKRAFAPEVEELLKPYREVIAALNPASKTVKLYPGSPEIVAKLCRPGDLMTFNELHPKDFALLAKRYEIEPRARVTNMDAALLIKASLPPPLRRGLILIDPPFENKNEREAILSALAHGHKRFSTGVFMVWYPVKGESFAEKLLADVQALSFPATLQIEMRVREPFAGGGLAGSGVIVVNPPFVLPDEMRILIPALAKRMGIGKWGRGTVEWLVPPAS